MAELMRDPYPMPEEDFSVTPGSEEDKNWQAMVELQAKSDALPEQEVVGRVLKWNRGDGYAIYVVVDDHPLTLQWVPFGDRWRVENALIKGLDLEEVRRMVAQHNAFRQLFGRR